jgi:hypothetical protein
MVNQYGKAFNESDDGQASIPAAHATEEMVCLSKNIFLTPFLLKLLHLAEVMLPPRGSWVNHFAYSSLISARD